MRNTTQFLKLQAAMKNERLHNLCRTHGLGITSIRRVAHHKVYDEDVLQETPDFDPKGILAPPQQALQLAKDALRLRYRATASDPEAIYRAGWWECPSQATELERVRQDHKRRKDTGVSEWDQLVAKLPEWLGCKLRGDQQ